MPPNNYRNISKPTFISKVLEKKLFISNSYRFGNSNEIFDKFQSSFSLRHSNESALFKVSDNILMHAYVGKCSGLLLLSLNAAFNTADHSIPLSKLRRCS